MNSVLQLSLPFSTTSAVRGAAAWCFRASHAKPRIIYYRSKPICYIFSSKVAAEHRLPSSFPNSSGRKFHRVYDRLYIPDDASCPEVAKIFDALASSYEEEYIVDVGFNQQVYAVLLRQALPRSSTHLGDHALFRVLDYGCGTGIAAQVAKTDFTNVPLELHGVDISRRMVQLSNARGILAKRLDHGRIPYPDAFFDAVVGAFVTYLFSSSEPYSEILRVLKPNARFAFNEFKPEGNWRTARKALLHEVGFRPVQFARAVVGTRRISRHVELVVASKQTVPHLRCSSG